MLRRAAGCRPVKRVAGLFVAALLLAACADQLDQTLPDGVSAADVALFTSAVTQAGCSITPENAVLVETATGFDRPKLQIITQYLTLAGRSQPTSDGFRLTSGSCANA